MRLLYCNEKLLLFSCSVMSNSLATPWTVACQAPLSMEFSRKQYFSGLPFPSPGDLPDPGIEPGSPALQADSLPSEPPGKPRSLQNYIPELWLGVGDWEQAILTWFLG